MSSRNSEAHLLNISVLSKKCWELRATTDFQESRTKMEHLISTASWVMQRHNWSIQRVSSTTEELTRILNQFEARLRSPGITLERTVTLSTNWVDLTEEIAELEDQLQSDGATQSMLQLKTSFLKECGWLIRDLMSFSIVRSSNTPIRSIENQENIPAPGLDFLAEVALRDGSVSPTLVDEEERGKNPLS